ncbi:MAG: isoprenylcysteine carboxylmethyltransferase family protein [Planctomycetes bacterium]|nr:isoprenylcysteine carboxylmethyltransferase family protein [Planctomycetota bacterium]
MWSTPVEECWIRAGIVAFVCTKALLSAVRSALFAWRHGRRPVAPPRDASERRVYGLFLSLMAAAGLDCATRWLFPQLYRWWLPMRALEVPALFGASLLLIVGGAGFTFYCQSAMGRSWRIGIPAERTELVTTGVYSRIRHPIYAGFLAWLAGLVLLLPNLLSLAIFVGGVFVLTRWARREEARQLEIHGEAYRNYCARTGRFLPTMQH